MKIQKNLSIHDQILSEYKNVNIVCTGENLGYGAGNNFGIKSVKTDYILILNPDVICDKNFFQIFLTLLKKKGFFNYWLSIFIR